MQTPDDQDNHSAAKRGKPPWVKPTVEVISMKDALTGPTNIMHNTDGPTGYS